MRRLLFLLLFWLLLLFKVSEKDLKVKPFSIDHIEYGPSRGEGGVRSWLVIKWVIGNIWGEGES